MSNEDVEVRLIEVFKNIFNEHSSYNFLNYSIVESSAWDSLAMIQIILGVEKSFSISIPAEELDRLHSFQSIYSLLCEKLTQ